jgi:hypothetical protein
MQRLFAFSQQKNTFLCSGLQSELENPTAASVFMHCFRLSMKYLQGAFPLKQVQGTTEEWVCTKIGQNNIITERFVN